MPQFDGLNLTWETLEGLVKHNGPLTDRGGAPVGRYASAACRTRSSPTAKIQDLELWSLPSAEAQIAALADDIAYDAHDIDDGLRAGLFIARRPRRGAAGRRHRGRHSRRHMARSSRRAGFTR